ncbi:similar to Saccharomyces cerevisiae YMR232W FUS2 Cytoplasmic protein localized to the shmoo tip [Maudiozyma barnettii]|uniref:Similar to Saccharomyces cerevisiae YMR232W FUS2 Cytoplasmic protein localized to the shmoo tip n=1 Tax=Maudiozyma barnettii TaxID=61262 RepID=A0A8H2ZFS8_9SACH|nr:Fus2p [Kazachstania barnettii]CAB4252670.1 similar to Saccharomyces cerevisiae YMR232W FUS2 Cytoplasmic protein localized to the shmoo tip [Kazachstania barnettii]CAD1780460.1 similar to Saccharomyces cerevisiae YMR232W FUS2 Cytoplasmic protein localized to the shmoo tip [Kazachstania barnettii]
MFKTSTLFDQIHYQTSNNLTPIRDYKHDYFHEQDDKLPKFEGTKVWRLQSLKYDKSHSIKRPLSLELDDVTEPLSISITPSSSSEYSSNSTINSKERHEFFNLIENFHDSEFEFCTSLKLVNSVYRESLHQNKQLYTKFIKDCSTDELLLFGNIDTICSISEIFVTSLRDILTMNDIYDWNPSEEKNHSNFQIRYEPKKNVDIASVFEQHLFRCSSTYMSYAAGHCKQMKLYDELAANKKFQEWYQSCMKKAHFRALRDLLKYPLNRVDSWLSNIDRIIKLMPNVLDTEECDQMGKIRDKYVLFQKKLTIEISDYGSNPDFDFTLTPSEIIQSYDNLGESNPDNQIHTSGNWNSQTNDNPRLTTSSSFYSENSCSESTDQSTSKYTTEKNCTENIASPEIQRSLLDYIIVFKKMYRKLQNLHFFMSKLDLFTILDTNLTTLTLWEKLVNFEKDGYQLFPFDELKLYDLNKNKQNIVHMKEQITVLCLTDLELGVLTPLNTILKNCSSIRVQLRDLKVLEKDYVVYLKEKKRKVHDIKRNVIGKHYELLQLNLKKELPIFIALAESVLTICLSRYNKAMIEYFKILSGGETILNEDREHRGPTYDPNVSSNLDLLQAYSISRSQVKRLIHANWPYDGQAINSKIVRGLFEL